MKTDDQSPARFRSERWRRLFRYSAVSVVAVLVNQTALAIGFGLLHLPARTANLFATACATVPAFQLNRRWVWKQSGRSHFRREVLPFWVMAFLGLAFSTWSTGVGESWAEDNVSSRALQTIVVMASSLASYGLLWVAKFLVLDHLVFADRPDESAESG